MIKHYWRTDYRALAFYKREYFNIFSVGIYQILHFDVGTKTDEHIYPSTSLKKIF